MIKIGITGGIGSGKSVVADLLETMGIPVYIADTEAKRIMCNSKEIIDALSLLTGENVLCNDGTVNRALLAGYMFGNERHIKRVNEIVHPHVRRDFEKWSAQRESLNAVGMESAILFEADFAREVDFVVMVDAPLELRVQRIVKRDGVTIPEAWKKIGSQMGNRHKRKMSDFIIDNDGERPIIPQVLKLLDTLSLK